MGGMEQRREDLNVRFECEEKRRRRIEDRRKGKEMRGEKEKKRKEL